MEKQIPKINQADIHFIKLHSNWSEKSINKLLEEQIYSNKKSWHTFLRLFFISLGVGFTMAGILFFFAYNWAELHKFIKIGLIEGVLILIIALILFSKIRLDIKNILLTGASILVGVLFAVFGQIYQTGANAYDFFLGWTLFITIWVVISNFAPLWLVYITLINTTIVLYSQQVAHDWSELFLLNILFIVNVIFLLISIVGKKIIKETNSPNWFTNTLALAITGISTFGISLGLFDNYQENLQTLVLLTLILYAVGIWYGLKEKNSFYLAIIAFSVIVICSSILIKLSDDMSMFFFISLFIIASITMVIKFLIDLQKKWTK